MGHPYRPLHTLHNEHLNTFADKLNELTMLAYEQNGKHVIHSITVTAQFAITCGIAPDRYMDTEFAIMTAAGAVTVIVEPLEKRIPV